MAEKGLLTITLQLPDLDALFETPQLSPFSEQYHEYSYTAGIEFIAAELHTSSSYNKVRALLILPDSLIEPGLEEKVRAAIERYVRARLLAIEHEVGALRWRGRRSLRLALALIPLGLFIGLAYLSASSENLPLQLISQGLAIAGWVVLWGPLEALFFDRWEHRQDRRIYRLLMEMEIQISPKQ